MSVIIKDSKVKLDNQFFQETAKGSFEISQQSAINKFLLTIQGDVNNPESYSPFDDSKLYLNCSIHPVLKALKLSYSYHLPFVISPDMVWLMITQGFAKHITLNAEKYRSHFVNFEGKKEIIVDTQEVGGRFMKGEQSDFQNTFPQFEKKIKEFIGEENVGLLVQQFSTTTPTELQAFQLTLMECMKKYFSYTVRTMCGHPEYIIEGTKEDWNNIITYVQQYRKFDLNNWIDKLSGVLGNIVASIENPEDENILVWWRQILEHNNFGSGKLDFNGWIQVFFPYIKNYKGEEILNTYFNSSFDFGDIHKGINCTPFNWQFYGMSYNMEFLSGFTSVQFDIMSKQMKPVIGWAVREAKEKEVVVNG